MTPREFMIETMARFERAFGKEHHMLIAMMSIAGVEYAGCCETSNRIIAAELNQRTDAPEDVTLEVQRAKGS